MQHEYAHSLVELQHRFFHCDEVYSDQYVRIFQVVVDQQPALVVDRSQLALLYDEMRDSVRQAPPLIDLLIFADEPARNRYVSTLTTDLQQATVYHQQSPSARDGAQLGQLYAAVAVEYAVHCAVRYPPGYRREINETNLVLLDASLSGCISTFLHRQGDLGLWRTAALGLRYGAVVQIVPTITDTEAASYFQRLEDLANYVLYAVGMQAKSLNDA